MLFVEAETGNRGEEEQNFNFIQFKSNHIKSEKESYYALLSTKNYLLPDKKKNGSPRNVSGAAGLGKAHDRQLTSS